ncbi:hypothetical protein Adt_06821 [Abeliophyllum distichum]|uniref:Uncharacterized protein n=1 Tax=Abeliophyllum distichum TaxID=126358 RepID=A0ABD1V810_9LAMI
MGGGGVGGLSKLGKVLTIIFVISLVALFAELFYVLWRRRVFRRKNPLATSDGGGDQLSHSSCSDSSFLSIASWPSSKELLYSFFIRSHSRVEHNSVTPTSDRDNLNSNGPSEMEEIDIDVMTLQEMYGPPRFLFTIKEEEREELEAVAEKIDNNNNNKENVSLQECFIVAEESSDVVVAVAVDIDDHDGCDTLPFSTPCASPMYFTPSSSPVHDISSAL